jgi:hypothetical protein
LRQQQKTAEKQSQLAATDNARDHVREYLDPHENLHTIFPPEKVKTRTNIDDDFEDETTSFRRRAAPSHRRSAPPKPPSDRTAKTRAAPPIKKRDRTSFSAGKLSPLASTDHARDRRVASPESDFDENEHTIFKPQESLHLVKNKVDNDFDNASVASDSSTASRRSSAISSTRRSAGVKTVPPKPPLRKSSFFGLFSDERKRILKSCALKPIMIDLSKTPEENLQDHPDEIRPLIHLALFDERHFSKRGSQRKSLFNQIKKRCRKPEKCHIGWLVNRDGVEFDLLHANEICGDDDTTTVFFVRFSLLNHLIFIVGFGQHSDRSKVQDHDKIYYDLEFFFFEGYKVKTKPRVVINVADDTSV